MAVTTPAVEVVDGGSPRRGQGGASTGRLGDRLFSGLAHGAGILVILMVVLVGAFLVSQAIPALA
jgi:phosphate transport system permease protein